MMVLAEMGNEVSNQLCHTVLWPRKYTFICVASTPVLLSKNKSNLCKYFLYINICSHVHSTSSESHKSENLSFPGLIEVF